MSISALACSFSPAWEGSLEARLETWRDRGHRILAATVRRELAKENAAWAEALDEHALLDPLLVACTSQSPPAMALSQCTWGLLPPGLRAHALRVKAFEDGRVLLPGLGVFEAVAPEATVTVRMVEGDPRLDEYPEARVCPLPEVEGLSVYPHRHPFLRPFIERHGDHYACTRVSEATRHNVGALAEALRLLASTDRCLHAELLRDTRLVIILEHRAVPSMAVLPFHGAVLLSVRGHESPLFFVEELVLHGSRVTFSKVIADWPAFLAVPYPTPLRALGVDDHDPRCVGDAFHGNYALMRTLMAFESLLDHSVLRGHFRHELLGRIALALHRFGEGLSLVDHPGLYTEQGLVLHRAMSGTHARLLGRLGGLLRVLDVADQPAVFEYQRFLARNPR